MCAADAGAEGADIDRGNVPGLAGNVNVLRSITVLLGNGITITHVVRNPLRGRMIRNVEKQASIGVIVEAERCSEGVHVAEQLFDPPRPAGHWLTVRLVFNYEIRFFA